MTSLGDTETNGKGPAPREEGEDCQERNKKPIRVWMDGRYADRYVMNSNTN